MARAARERGAQERETPLSLSLEVVEADGFQAVDIPPEWSSRSWRGVAAVRRSTARAVTALVVARPPDDPDGLLQLALTTSTPARLERVRGRTESLAAHAVLVLAVGAATGWRATEDEILVDVRPSGAPAAAVAGFAGSVSVSLSHERGLIAALARAWPRRPASAQAP